MPLLFAQMQKRHPKSGGHPSTDQRIGDLIAFGALLRAKTRASFADPKGAACKGNACLTKLDRGIRKDRRATGVVVTRRALGHVQAQPDQQGLAPAKRSSVATAQVPAHLDLWPVVRELNRDRREKPECLVGLRQIG